MNRNIIKQREFALNYTNTGSKLHPYHALYMNIMKQRSLSATYTFTKIYGGTKTTLTSRIKKGAGKGGVRKTTFYKQDNTFENLTFMGNKL